MARAAGAAGVSAGFGSTVQIPAGGSPGAPPSVLLHGACRSVLHRSSSLTTDKIFTLLGTEKGNIFQNIKLGWTQNTDHEAESWTSEAMLLNHFPECHEKRP